MITPTPIPGSVIVTGIDLVTIIVIVFIVILAIAAVVFGFTLVWLSSDRRTERRWHDRG